MIRKILKWGGLTLLGLIAAIGTITAFRQNVRYEAPYPEISACTDSAVIARGRHLVISSAHCINCHSTQNPDSILKLGKDPALTGGVVFNLPLGKIYSRNITPDPETGIGKMSDPEIARALRYGVHADGTVVFDFMAFHNTSDEDLTAIISYLRAQKPVKNKVPEHDLNIAGNLVKAFMVKPVGPDGPVPETVKPDTTAAYGKYLALNVAECSGCHTKRDMTGKFVGDPFAGGGPINENGHMQLPPNLTPDSSSRIFGWTQEDFIKRFRMGKVIPYSVMPWNSYQRMTDDELKAIYAYLKTVKPAKTTVNAD
ncbi:MAG TPA: cytochrome c [Chitinophagaceae bacterium]|jgi:mono/diheme cytochrome c family protein|nr:cytochrome c [Chitinophagaceae bacterium]